MAYSSSALVRRGNEANLHPKEREISEDRLFSSLGKLQHRCTCSNLPVDNVSALLERLDIRGEFEKSSKSQLEEFYDTIVKKLYLVDEIMNKQSRWVFQIELNDDFWKRLDLKFHSEIAEFNVTKSISCQEHIAQENSRLFTGLAFSQLMKGDYKRYLETMERILDFDPENTFALLHYGLHLNFEGNLEQARGIAAKLSHSRESELNEITFLADIGSSFNYLGPKYSNSCIKYFSDACVLLIRFSRQIVEHGTIDGKLNCKIRILYCNIAFGFVSCSQGLSEHFFQAAGGDNILKPIDVISLFNKCKIFLKGLCTYFKEMHPYNARAWILWPLFYHSFDKNLTQYVKSAQGQQWKFVIFREDLQGSKQPSRHPECLDKKYLTKVCASEALQLCLPEEYYSLTRIAKQIRNLQFTFKELNFNPDKSKLSKDISEIKKKSLLEQFRRNLGKEEFLVDCEMLYLLVYKVKRTWVTLDGLLYIYLRACTSFHFGYMSMSKGRRSKVCCEEMDKMLKRDRPAEIMQDIFGEFTPCNKCIFLSFTLKSIEENPEDIWDSSMIRAHYSIILFRLNAQKSNKPYQVTISENAVLRKIEDCFHREMNDKSSLPQNKYCMLDQYATIHYYLGHYQVAILNYLKGLSMLIEYKYRNIPSILDRAWRYIDGALNYLRNGEDPFRIANISYVLQHNIEDFSIGNRNVEAGYASQIKTRIEAAIQDLKTKWQIELPEYFSLI